MPWAFSIPTPHPDRISLMIVARLQAEVSATPSSVTTAPVMRWIYLPFLAMLSSMVLAALVPTPLSTNLVTKADDAIADFVIWPYA